MKALAEVITLYPDNCRDIVAKLREAADSIESETDDNDRTEAVVSIMMHESGEVTIYGWGDAPSFKAMAMLAIAQAQLATNHIERNA